MDKLPNSRHLKPYDKGKLQLAFDATLKGMSVYRASKVFQVPESTLRDRTRHNVALDCVHGKETLLSREEEISMVKHIKYMADIGYGYSKTNIQYMGADYARSVGKEIKGQHCFSSKWFYAFLKRWPEIKLVKPQKLTLSRAKSASKEAIGAYFHELSDILLKNGLLDNPERIYNVDETGISTEHSPSKIVCATETKPQAVTSPRSSNVTIIAGANAIGNFIPPYYVFPGKRWNGTLLDGAPPGSDGVMSETGWSNTATFEKYVMEHFSKYASVGKDKPTTLLLYDGHKSHISLTLTEWAKRNNVVLFVLPPHTSHLTQPLDVGVFGPLKTLYYKECQKYMQQNPGMTITKHEVAQLTSKPYTKALCPDNIQSAFKKSGVYPLDVTRIDQVQTAPATIYQHCCDVQTPHEAGCTGESAGPSASLPNENAKHQTNLELNTEVADNDFFEKRTIRKVVEKKKRKFTPPFKITGDLSKLSSNVLTSERTKKQKTDSVTYPRLVRKGNKTDENQSDPEKIEENLSNAGDMVEEDKCCVCQLSEPKEIQTYDNLAIVKWGKCDFCPHWTHLTFCTKIKTLRRHSIFRCPHCEE